MNRELYARLDDPQVGQKFIHVAGTNGKGSTSAMLAEILSCCGYKTGLFTSPHLERFTERIKINGEEISQDDWDRLKAEVEKKAEGLDTVGFDVMTAMAFLYFREQGCDIVVLEVGLGGRLDATNVIEYPAVSVIASIGLEHTELLGDTVEKITFEKAGIIKKGRPVVVQHQSRSVLEVFRAKALETDSEIIVTEPSMQFLHSLSFDGQVFSYKSHEKILLRLLGSYQYKNAALVLDTVDVLRTQGFSIPETAVKKALAQVVWHGRFEIVRREPLVILDGAHNPDGAQALADCIKLYLPNRKIDFVMGVLADKNYESMLELTAPFANSFTVVSPDSSRALSAERLKEIINTKYHIRVCAADTVSSGVKLAVEGQSHDIPVIIFGSLYQVAEVRRLLCS